MKPNGRLRSDDTRRSTILEKEISYSIVGAFFQVYNELGFGFLESIYTRALEVSLGEKGLLVQREVPITVVFHGVEVGQHRLDMLVEHRIVLEIKSTERMNDIRNDSCVTT